MLKVRYWVPDINGNPLKVTHEVSPDPWTWQRFPDHALIYLVGEVDELFLELLIEDAAEAGWSFNPITRCFYKP